MQDRKCILYIRDTRHHSSESCATLSPLSPLLCAFTLGRTTGLDLGCLDLFGNCVSVRRGSKWLAGLLFAFRLLLAALAKLVDTCVVDLCVALVL